MLKLGLAAWIAAPAWSSSYAASPEAKSVCEREMAHAAQTHGIPLSILYSVGLTETGRRGELNPFAMNIDGATVHSESLPAALETYRNQRARGASLIDVGCMQINVRWHGNKFKSVEEMFNPRLNVQYSASFLKELRARYGTWTLAVARYNAGPDNNKAQRAYVCNVVRQLVKSGMGQWTDGARQFCGAGPERSSSLPDQAPNPPAAPQRLTIIDKTPAVAPGQGLRPPTRPAPSIYSNPAGVSLPPARFTRASLYTRFPAARKAP